MDAHALVDRSRVTDLIATAEQAGAAGDRELHHTLLWIVAARTWWANPGPEIRQPIVDAADRAGPPTAADPRLVSIHAYADPFPNASKVLDYLREAADSGTPGEEPAGYLASAGLVVGAFYDSLTFCTTAIECARAEGRLGFLPRLLARQAIMAVRLPDWDIAIPAAEEACRLATELDQPIWLAAAETAVAMIAAVRGDPAETERATARAEQIALPLGAAHLVALAQSGPILSALAQGRDEEALRLAERLFDSRDPAHHLHFACMAIGDLAEAAAHTGRSQEARERLAQVETLVGDDPAEWIAINLRHARAVLADDEREAAVRFEEALSADLDRWPFWRGRLLLAHGRWLRRHRHVADSRAPLREARDVFDAIGASNWGDHTRAELRASGERSRRRMPEARDQLTAQELQIAQLAAEGLSNREIGQRLYLSHRMISTHLLRRRRGHRIRHARPGRRPRLHRSVRARHRRVGQHPDRRPAARRAGAADPAAPGRLPVPGPREVRGVLRGGPPGRARSVHGRLAGPVGPRGAQRHDQRARLAQQAQLVPGRVRRPHDPAARAAGHVRAGRLDRHRGGRQPLDLRLAAARDRGPDRAGRPGGERRERRVSPVAPPRRPAGALALLSAVSGVAVAQRAARALAWRSAARWPP
jgi:DNA-binding CsgD family transcriptional regulator